MIFSKNVFAEDKHIYELPKASIADRNQTFKDGALSGFGWSL